MWTAQGALHRRQHTFSSFTSTLVLMCVSTVGEMGSIFKNSLMLFCLAVVLFVVFTRTQMGSSLYELDLELFEDVDSEVGNYFIVATWTDIFISTVLVLLRGFFQGSKVLFPPQKPTLINSSSILQQWTNSPSVGCATVKFKSFFCMDTLLINHYYYYHHFIIIVIIIIFN